MTQTLTYSWKSLNLPWIASCQYTEAIPRISKYILKTDTSDLMSPCILSLDILELSQDVPLASIISTTLCQHKHTCILIHIDYRHPWILQRMNQCRLSKCTEVILDIPRLSKDDILPAGTPPSKYPCMPTLPWMSLDYPRVTHCQQADPSVKVSLYAKVT